MGPLIIKYALFFPLLLPIFEERALVTSDLYPTSYPRVYSDTQIQLQREGLRVSDRGLRLVICRELRETNLESAYAIVLEQLGKEAEAKMIAGVLEELSLSPHGTAAVAQKVAPSLDHASEDVRYWAAECYGRVDGVDPAPLLSLLERESSEVVRGVAAERLSALSESVPLQSYRAFWEDDNPSVQRSMLVGGCRRTDSEGSVDAVLARMNEAEVTVRYGLADVLDEVPATLRQALVAPLRDDGHAAVRGALAAALGRAGEQEHLASLLALCEDEDPEVRRRAVVACREFPTEAVRKAYVTRLGDPATLVRREVEDALVGLHDSVSVAEAVAARLDDPADFVRYHACRVLGRLALAQYGETIHALLKREQKDVNIAACAFALGQFGTKAAAPTIAARAAHPSLVVRETVAEALGRLAVAETFDKLDILAFDQEEAVRHAAIIGMGRIGSGNAFNATILKVLKTVVEDKMTPENRAAAAWSASRLRPLDEALIQRLKVQCTTPVVPGEMGEMLFEEDHVLGSLAFALATWAREDAAAEAVFREVNDAYSYKLPPNTVPPPDVVIVPSAEINEVARQTLAYFESRTPEKARRPTTTVRLNYDRSMDRGR